MEAIVLGKQSYLEYEKGLFQDLYCLIALYDDLLITIVDTNIANYANGNTPFASDDTTLYVITSLENAAVKPFEWFTKNQIKVHHDNCHLLMNALTPISIK